MKEAYVKLETAKLLKEKGFDWDTDKVYERSLMACRYEDYPMPTQQMACRWLRETYGLWVVPIHWLYGGCYFKIYKCYGKVWKDNVYDYTDYENFDEPEDAVEAALQYCLTNLI